MKALILIICLIALAGCKNMNLSSTVAGGACGFVDYSVTFMGAPMVGVKANRECTDEDETEDASSEKE